MDESLRESLSKSFDTVAAAESGTPAPAPEPSPAPEPAPSPEPAPTPAPEPSPTPAPIEGELKEPVEGIQDEGAAPTPAPAPESATGQTEKAPGTWGAEARETWKDLPPRARQEIWKREKDAVRALTISTKARQFSEKFEETMRPYMGFIAAEGAQPLQAVDYMMRTAALFRVGSAEQKAQAVAGICKQWKIDLDLLDSMLAGAPAPQRQQSGQVDIQAEVQRALQPILAPVMQRQQQMMQEIDQEVEQDLAAFAADPKHEFYNDVKADMADIMELAQKRGVKISLTQAYERATLLSESVRRTIEARKTRQQAQTSQQIADRARHAAASVPGSSVGSGVSVSDPGNSVRASIEAAIARHTGS